MARFAATNEAVRKRWFPYRDTLFAADYANLPQQHLAPDPQAGFAAACSALLEAADASLKREIAQLMQIVRLANAAGEHERAKAALVHVLRADSTNIPARIALAEQYIARGDLKAARASCNATRKIAPDDRAVRKLDEKSAELGLSFAGPSTGSGRRGRQVASS